VLKGIIPKHHRVIDISTNTSIGGQAAPEDLVAYLMETAEVGLPDEI